MWPWRGAAPGRSGTGDHCSALPWRCRTVKGEESISICRGANSMACILLWDVNSLMTIECQHPRGPGLVLVAGIYVRKCSSSGVFDNQHQADSNSDVHGHAVLWGTNI